MGYRVLITARSFGQADEGPLRELERSGCEVERSLRERPLTEEEMREALRDKDGLIVGVDPVSAAALEAAPGLKVVSKYGVGVDNIDVPAATRRGVVVTSTPEANTEAVADLTFGLMLAAGRRIVEAHNALREGTWQRFVGVDVWGQTLGLVGTGRIGRAVARRAQGFNMRILAHDIVPDYAWAEWCGARYVNLEALMAESDFVTLHLPLTPATRGLVGGALLQLMKPTAVIVNTARGGIIDESALVSALREKRIFGAALDVFAVESPCDPTLLGSGGLVTTPHIGAQSLSALRLMATMAVENLLAVFHGVRPRHVVNPSVYSDRREGDDRC